MVIARPLSAEVADWFHVIVVVTIKYQDDLLKAKQILEQILAENALSDAGITVPVFQQDVQIITS
jgi:hypothetical protein